MPRHPWSPTSGEIRDGGTLDRALTVSSVANESGCSVLRSLNVVGRDDYDEAHMQRFQSTVSAARKRRNGVRNSGTETQSKRDSIRTGDVTVINCG